MRYFLFSLTLFTILSFCFFAEAKCQYSQSPNEYIFYNINAGTPFTYNKTLPFSGHVQFNCPFAYIT